MRFHIRDVLWAMVVVGLVIALYKEKERYTKVVSVAYSLEMAFDGLAEFAVETGDWVIELEEEMLTISPAKDRNKQQFSRLWTNPPPVSHSFHPLPGEWSPERENRWLWRNEDSAL